MLHRYLAVRCGLAVAVELDVSGQQERTPLGKLQPQSLAATYHFLPKRSLLPDAKVCVQRRVWEVAKG